MDFIFLLPKELSEIILLSMGKKECWRQRKVSRFWRDFIKGLEERTDFAFLLREDKDMKKWYQIIANGLFINGLETDKLEITKTDVYSGHVSSDINCEYVVCSSNTQLSVVHFSFDKKPTVVFQKDGKRWGDMNWIKKGKIGFLLCLKNEETFEMFMYLFRFGETFECEEIFVGNCLKMRGYNVENQLILNPLHILSNEGRGNFRINRKIYIIEKSLFEKSGFSFDGLPCIEGHSSDSDIKIHGNKVWILESKLDVYQYELGKEGKYILTGVFNGKYDRYRANLNDRFFIMIRGLPFFVCFAKDAFVWNICKDLKCSFQGREFNYNPVIYNDTLILEFKDVFYQWTFDDLENGREATIIPISQMPTIPHEENDSDKEMYQLKAESSFEHEEEEEEISDDEIDPEFEELFEDDHISKVGVAKRNTMSFKEKGISFYNKKKDKKALLKTICDTKNGFSYAVLSRYGVAWPCFGNVCFASYIDKK